MMDRVSNLHAHIFSAAGAELGVVDAIWDWNYAERLDGAGEWHLECWATLANETLLAEGRRVDLYGTLEEVEQALSSGPISGIEPTMNLGGSTFYVTGKDRIAELATRVIPALDISERGWARLVAPDSTVRGRVRYLKLSTDCKFHDLDRPEMYDNDAVDPTLPDLTTYADCRLRQPQWKFPCPPPDEDRGRLMYEYLYVGFDTRFDRVYLDFETPNTSETGALAAQYYAGDSGWVAPADLVDGTKSGSYAFAQDGEITWTMPEDWERTSPTESAGDWFWMRFSKLGYDRTDEIDIRDVRVYSDVPTTNALNLIMAYAPTTWTQSGYAATDEPAYDVITGMTVLAALDRLREQIGGHYRAEFVGGLMEIQWFTDFSASGIIASGLQQPDETHVRLTKLVPKTDLTEFITRVYPIAENATLADTMREMSAPYEIDLDAGFIRNTDAETAYGRRERMMEFEVASADPEDSYFYHPVLTANTLCDVALEWLKQRDSVAEFYDASATGFREMFEPGYTIGLDSEATVQGDKTIDINTTVNVVSVRSTFDQAGFLAADLEVTTIERQAMTDARVVAEAIGSQHRTGSIRAVVGGGDAQTLGGYPAGAFVRVTEPTIITANWQFRVSPAQGAGDAVIEIGAQPIPHISFKVETDSGYLDELMRLGDLLGNWGYTGDAEQFGLAIGKYDTNLPNLTIDQINGLRIRSYETLLFQAAMDGTASIAGWDLNAASLSKAGAILHSSGYLSLGTGNNIARLDAANADYRLWIGHATAGSAPFRVTKGGALTATAATITGTITANAGSIAGWSIQATELRAGSGANRVGLRPGTYPIYAGHETPGSAPFRVTQAGALTATNAAITGAITATSGTLQTLDVTGTLTLKSAAIIKSDNYASGYAGWQVDYAGRAEFSNVIVRGELHCVVFVKDLVDARAGTLIIAKSAGALHSDMVVPGSGTWSAVLDDPPGGGFLFSNSDICRCTSEYSGGVATTWFVVSGRTDNGNGTQTYTCTYSSGTKSITYPAGAPIVDYGVSGQGVLRMTAESALHGPYYGVATHAGAPWTTMTERARLGNLNGVAGIGSDIYGLFAGDYAGGDYLLYQAGGDPGFLVKAGGGAVSIDDDGIVIETTSDYAEKRAYRFKDDSGNVVGMVDSYFSAGVNSVRLIAPTVAGKQPSVTIKADAPDGSSSKVYISAYGQSAFPASPREAAIYLDYDLSTLTGTIVIGDPTITTTVGGGFNVAATGAPAGAGYFAGALRSTGLRAYDGAVPFEVGGSARRMSNSFFVSTEAAGGADTFVVTVTLSDSTVAVGMIIDVHAELAGVERAMWNRWYAYIALHSNVAHDEGTVLESSLGDATAKAALTAGAPEAVEADNQFTITFTNSSGAGGFVGRLEIEFLSCLGWATAISVANDQ